MVVGSFFWHPETWDMRHEKWKVDPLEDPKFENTENQGCNMIPLQTEEQMYRIEEMPRSQVAPLPRGRRITLLTNETAN